MWNGKKIDEYYYLFCKHCIPPHVTPHCLVHNRIQPLSYCGNCCCAQEEEVDFKYKIFKNFIFKIALVDSDYIGWKFIIEFNDFIDESDFFVKNDDTTWEFVETDYTKKIDPTFLKTTWEHVGSHSTTFFFYCLMFDSHVSNKRILKCVLHFIKYKYNLNMHRNPKFYKHCIEILNKLKVVD